MRFVVTGGAGFIGSNLCKDLVYDGAHVTIIDNFERGRREYILDIIDSIELIEGDLKNLNFCIETIKNFDIVIHMASKANLESNLIIINLFKDRKHFETKW